MGFAGRASASVNGIVARVAALSRHPRADRLACDATAVGFILAALVVATRTTHGLPGPYDLDHWRDIAQAQTVRDGHLLSDPYYRGEWAWYNPLVAWTVALGSLLFNTSVTQFHTQAGPYLNLLGPVALYLLVRHLNGPRAALGGLTLYLFFVCGDEPSWAYPTYSPWLFTTNFAQGLFFISLLALVVAHERRSPARLLSAGALMGLTFLCHTVPAAILAGIACVLFATEPLLLFTVGVAALTVAAPFLFAIGAHYRFHVVNRVPLAWQFEQITVTALPLTVANNALLVAGWYRRTCYCASLPRGCRVAGLGVPAARVQHSGVADVSSSVSLLAVRDHGATHARRNYHRAAVSTVRFAGRGHGGRDDSALARVCHSG